MTTAHGRTRCFLKRIFTALTSISLTKYGEKQGNFRQTLPLLTARANCSLEQKQIELQQISYISYRRYCFIHDREK